MNHTTDWVRRWRNTGYVTFFLSGICAISSGIIVSILQGKYGFDYGMTGTMLGLMSIGNMAASFAAGVLPQKIGVKNTVLFLCSGYFLGYFLMAVTGMPGVLMAAFLLVGFAKGGALNNCTILVKDNSADRTRSMNILHACYASGALLCPFLAASLLGINDTLPMVGVAVTGLLLWVIFLTAGLPGVVKEKNGERGKISFAFLKDPKFWLITGLLFCQNAAETSVTGWLVTYYRQGNPHRFLCGVHGNGDVGGDADRQASDCVCFSGASYFPGACVDGRLLQRAVLRACIHAASGGSHRHAVCLCIRHGRGESDRRGGSRQGDECNEPRCDAAGGGDWRDRDAVADRCDRRPCRSCDRNVLQSDSVCRYSRFFRTDLEISGKELNLFFKIKVIY